MAIKVTRPQIDLREEINKALTLKGLENQLITVNGLVSNGKVQIGTNPRGYTGGHLFVHNDQGQDSTTKAELSDNAVLLLQPDKTNSTHMAIGQVDGGNGMGIQVTNASRTADWDIALNPFGGNVGIGNVDPSTELEVGNGSSTFVTVRNAATGDVSSGYNIASGSTTTTSLYGNADEGWTTLLSGGALNFRVNNAVSGFNPLGIATDGTVNFTEIMKLDGNSAYFISTAANGYRFNNSNDAFNNMIIAENGNVTIRGALSKGSGSFRIPHPVASKTATHDLVHSFLEAPQADNLYRGKVDLVAGSATVNIDTVAGMTNGTFAALNREVQCFTSNETGWTAVKGSVSGNMLTITAQDSSCTDTISWMVVGERKDQHMYDTDWTDDNGKVIVEPTKRPDKI